MPDLVSARSGQHTAPVSSGNERTAAQSAQTVQPALQTGTETAAANVSGAREITADNCRAFSSCTAINVAAAPPFSVVSHEIDVEDWLEVQKNCKFGHVDLSYWVVYATGCLDGQPNTEWSADKKEARLTNRTGELRQWDDFVAWCHKHLTMLNRDKIPLTNSCPSSKMVLCPQPCPPSTCCVCKQKYRVHIDCISDMMS